jgi:transcriptional regulator with AAA-type ATPase domain/tetratricopeptide (TPR) repeat protein
MPGVEHLGDLLGTSPAIRALREQVDRLLRQIGGRRLPPVLIQGETGSGKGLLAREMHRAGPRPDGPFVAVNCAAIPEPLLEAELFGFERGAFTDARQPKPGLFHAAHRGTLFLDEVGLLPAALQAKLLTAIEERSVRRLGSTRSEPVDAWILAATNADLAAEVRRGAFREDLYHRLAVLPLVLPTLRDRGDDVVVLAERFLMRACADYGLPAKTLGHDARAALRAYAWPGNVRELANVIERVALLGEASHVTAPMLGLPSLEREAAAAPAAPSLEDSVSDLERSRLLEVLHQTGWNVSRAATRLGISRNQVRYRIEKYELRPETEFPRRGRRRSAPASPPAAPEAGISGSAAWSPSRWERRHLAFVSAALVGPDATGAMVGHVEKLRAFGGTVEEVSPTRVVVAVGLDPVEDAPARAALAALAIRKEAERSQAVDPGGAAVTLAIHVAQALVGGPGGAARVDLDGRRAAVSVLEALLDRGEPGAIRVSAAAAPFLERRFELVPEGTGLRLVGRERSGFGLGGRPLSPFVGRRREVEAVEALAAQVERGRGQLLGIVGEPGVGKSRFVFELTRSERVRGWRVLGCGAVSYGTATAYLPIVDLLRSYFELDDSEPRPRLRDRVAEKLGALDVGLVAHLPALLALLELPVDDAEWHGLDPTHQRRRRLEAVKRLLLRESEAQPLLLVVEDLHWSDSETRAVLETLEESLPGARILLLVTYRPGYGHDRGSKTYYTQLRLDPLTPEGTAELLRRLLGHDDSLRPLAQIVSDRTEGNALFVEETVRTLVETGVVAGDLGAYRLAGPVETIQVPVTVEALLAARIDRLPPEDREVLQSAAVIGRDVPLGLLHALAGSGEEEALQAGLQRLQAAEFLYEVSLAGDPGCTFKHALTHDVAYGSLLQERRRTLHGRIVEAIERLHADRLTEHVERLAHHAVRGEVWGKALAYLRQAGDRAAARSAYREAVAAYEEALVVLRHLPESRAVIEQAIDLRLELRDTLQALMELDRILDHLAVAERLAESLGDDGRRGRVAAALSNTYFGKGRLDLALEAGTRALRIGELHADLALRVSAHVRLEGIHYMLGDYRQAIAHAGRAIELMGDRVRERFGLTGLASVIVRFWLTRSLVELGEFPEGIDRVQETTLIATSADHPFSVITAHLSLGELRLRQGNLAEAIPALEGALEIVRARGLRVFLAMCSSALGYSYAMVARLAEAVPLLEQAVERAHAVGQGSEQSRRLAWLAEARLLAGRSEEAARLAGQALELARDTKEQGNEAWALRLLGEIAAHREPVDIETTEGAFRQAMTLARRLEMRPLMAHCHLGLGRLYRRAGWPDAAREELEAGLALYRSMGMAFWVSPAEAELHALPGTSR